MGFNQTFRMTQAVELKTENGVFYTLKGSGPHTVVLLRGLVRWSAHWLGFDDLLAERGLRVIAVDNRGFGRSSKLAGGISLSVHDMADDVAQVIAKEAPGGAHVVGISLGAMIGLALASMKPQLVRSLVMVNSSVGGSGIPRISAKALLAITQIILFGRRGYDSLASALLGPDTPQETKQKLALSWSKIDRDAGVSMRGLWTQLVAARNFDGFVEMSAIHCPVTIVRCDQDQFVDPRNSDFLHRQMKNSEITKHPKAGHELAVDDPEWFLRVIKESLERASKVDAPQGG